MLDTPLAMLMQFKEDLDASSDTNGPGRTLIVKIHERKRKEVGKEEGPAVDPIIVSVSALDSPQGRTPPRAPLAELHRT